MVISPLLHEGFSSWTLQWRHNGCDGVSNHKPHDCLPNRLFRRRSKKTSKLRVTGLCAGNSPVIGELPTQMASNTDLIWFDDVIMDKFRAVAAYTSQNITATQFQWNWYKLLITPTVPIPPDRPAVLPHYQHSSWLRGTCVHLTVAIESRGSLGETDMRTFMGWSPETRGCSIWYPSKICRGCYGQP